MLVISKIRVHPNKGQTYLLELVQEGHPERVTLLEIHEDLIVRHNLRKGIPLPDHKLRELDEENEANKVYLSALNYISYRMRSTMEVQIFLRNKGSSDHLIEQAIEKLKDEHYLDDQAFAEAYVRSKKNTTYKGPAILAQELHQKGITQEAALKALGQFTEAEQFEQAFHFAEKKQNAWRGKSRKEIEQRMRQILLHKGFTVKIAGQVIEELLSNSDNDSDWTSLTIQGEKALIKYNSYTGFEKKVKIKQFLYRKGFSVDLIESWVNQQNIE